MVFLTSLARFQKRSRLMRQKVLKISTKINEKGYEKLKLRWRSTQINQNQAAKNLQVQLKKKQNNLDSNFQRYRTQMNSSYSHAFCTCSFIYNVSPRYYIIGFGIILREYSTPASKDFKILVYLCLILTKSQNCPKRSEFVGNLVCSVRLLFHQENEPRKSKKKKRHLSPAEESSKKRKSRSRSSSPSRHRRSSSSSSSPSPSALTKSLQVGHTYSVSKIQLDERELDVFKLFELKFRPFKLLVVLSFACAGYRPSVDPLFLQALFQTYSE